MKLQPASKKEVTRITVGTLVCDVIMIAALFLLSQFEIGSFDFIKILLGALCGSVIAVANFIILCLTIQSAVSMDNKKKMKAKFQFSYNARIILQSAWIVAAFLLRSKIHFIAAAAPVFFPKITILYLQFSGKLNSATASAQPTEQQEDTGDSGEEPTCEP